jgi:hypothetical protein
MLAAGKQLHETPLTSEEEELLARFRARYVIAASERRWFTDKVSVNSPKPRTAAKDAAVLERDL